MANMKLEKNPEIEDKKKLLKQLLWNELGDY